MQRTLKPATVTSILDAARRAIEAQWDREDWEASEVPDPPESSGVFVTVHVHRELRGCIGFLQLQGSLGATIADAARRAVAEDSRFLPVEKHEREAMTLDVTLLGPLERLTDIEDFDIGVHGLVIEHLGRRGLLLPQVAVEHRWDRRQFLSGLCRKAALPERSWEHPDAIVYRFEGMVLHERDVQTTPSSADDAAG